MPDFHRYTTTPVDYYNPSGGALPTGYDYINNDPGNPTGGGTTDRAYANPAKPSGANTGTYFTAWGDEATSANANRAHKALAENCDYIDNALRRRMGSPVFTAGVALSGGDAYYEIVGVSVWCGSSVSDDPRDLVQILDVNGDEIIKQTAGVNAAFYASDLQPIGGGGTLIGSGWSSTAGVRVVFSTTAAAATRYFRYTKLDSLLTMPAGSTTARVHRARAGYNVVNAVSLLKGPDAAPDTAITAAPVSSVADLAYGGLDARYRRQTTDAAYSFGSLDTPGGGAIIQRDGQAPTALSQINSGYADGVRTLVDPINAAWKADMRDAGQVGAGTAVLNKAHGSVGFASYGARWGVRGFDNYSPSIAGLLHAWAHRDTRRPVSDGTHVYTNVPAESSADLECLSSATLPYWVITLNGTGAYPDAYFWKDIGGSVLRTAIVRKRDLLEVTFTDATAKVVTRTFLIVELYTDVGGLGLNNRKALVTPLDMGSSLNIGLGVHPAVVTWVAPTFFVGDGAAGSTIAMDGLAAPAGISFTDVSLDGLYCVDPPLMTSNQGTSGSDFYAPETTSPTAFFGTHTSTKKAVSVAAFDNNATVGRYIEKGYWRGDGYLARTGALERNQALLAGATTWDVTLGATADLNAPTPSSGTTKAIAISGLPTAGEFLGGEVVIAVTIPAVTPTNQIDLTAAGLTMVWSAGADKTLTVGTSVYRGRQVGTKVYWSVERY